MPRRPLFCYTCNELLQQLQEAAEFAAQACERAYQPETKARLFTRYTELRAQMQTHLEASHPRCRVYNLPDRRHGV